MFYIFSYKKSNNTVLQFRPVFVFVKHLKTAWHLTEFTAHICRTKRWDEISLQIQVLVVCKLSICLSVRMTLLSLRSQPCAKKYQNSLCYSLFGLHVFAIITFNLNRSLFDTSEAAFRSVKLMYVVKYLK